MGSSRAPAVRSLAAMNLVRPALWLTLSLLAGACKKTPAPAMPDDAGQGSEHPTAAASGHADHAEQGAKAEPHAAEPHAAEPHSAEPHSAEPHSAEPPTAMPEGGPEHGDHAASAFTVPFVDQQDPLELTRNFFKEALGDNATYQREHKPEFFKAFATSQKPRVTIVACADSRVQANAFDSSPENDLFTVRNIGNQVRLNLGSIEYGVRHLKTPVLLVLGHSGCGAVKAAMGDASQESAAIRHELDGIALPKRKVGTSPEDAGPWLEGVTANVHDQVAFALEQFAEEVRTGRLTVVGAVYDFRNDLKRGAGKFSIIDVNGVKDAAKMLSFERLVLGLPPDAKPASGKPAPPPSPSSVRSQELQNLIELRDELRKATSAAGGSSAEVKPP